MKLKENEEKKCLLQSFFLIIQTRYNLKLNPSKCKRKESDFEEIDKIERK